jgi:hypothetical protein
MMACGIESKPREEAEAHAYSECAVEVARRGGAGEEGGEEGELRQKAEEG